MHCKQSFIPSLRTLYVLRTSRIARIILEVISSPSCLSKQLRTGLRIPCSRVIPFDFSEGLHTRRLSPIIQTHNFQHIKQFTFIYNASKEYNVHSISLISSFIFNQGNVGKDQKTTKRYVKSYQKQGHLFSRQESHQC